jgi:hypothetical protein
MIASLTGVFEIQTARGLLGPLKTEADLGTSRFGTDFNLDPDISINVWHPFGEKPKSLAIV